MLDPNAGNYMATSDNFSETYQNFDIGSDWVAEHPGDIIPLARIGRKLDELEYQRPRYITRPTIFRQDEELFSSLSELKQRRPRIARRILNATEMLFES